MEYVLVLTRVEWRRGVVGDGNGNNGIGNVGRGGVWVSQMHIRVVLRRVHKTCSSRIRGDRQEECVGEQ